MNFQKLTEPRGRTQAVNYADDLASHLMSARILPRLADISQPEASPAWIRALQDAITDPAELIQELGLDIGLLPAARRAAIAFPLRVPRSFVARMRHGDPADPLLRQVMPLGAELEEVPGFGADPVGDLGSIREAGVLQKYHGRALLITTGACGVHCRFCFRRHFPYSEQSAGRDSWRPALETLGRSPQISEVILSGGDPLSLADGKLSDLVEGIERLPHIRRLRIHTRQPIVLPERVDQNLLRWLSLCRLQVVLVLHANHANELDEAVTEACTRLRMAGVTLLNQSVLLRGVNDSLRALSDLSERLMEVGVLPYYLHLLDRVAGAAHFEVQGAAALTLHQALAARLPGYLVPRLVREIPGEPGKTLL